ncbi:sphingomyelin phosphodiesterase [Rhizodiscina lignyota]|uniref:Sphingomyelin phosphodiesterase n=1 Tax=Rhizodiscina lignyota TaxID=1504668 RepID=A0A9P4I4D1_9PEZI|nr:sphingomyelin phosphodiesterase [Rhizodiscina lignyota]
MQFLTSLLVLWSVSLAAVASPAPSSITLQKPFNATATLEHLIDDVNKKTCSDCQDILLWLQAVARRGLDEFSKLWQDLCLEAQGDTVDGCNGRQLQDAVPLAYVLSNMDIPSHTSTIFCNVVFSQCDLPPVRPYKIPFPKPKPAKSLPRVSGKKPINVVHISDVHVDLEYVVGSNYNCSNGICCRVTNPIDGPKFTQYAAGPFGNSHCDSPLSLEKSMYSAINEIVPDKEFTLFTGDLIEGATWLSEAEAVDDMNDVHLRQSTLGQVYPAFGNHDTDPVDQFPLEGLPLTRDWQWVYNTISENWKPWIGEEAAQTVKTNFGRYSIVRPDTKLRIISMNTMFWMRVNFFMYLREMPFDPNGQFAWLVEELQKAEDNEERVYIIGHVPMGRVDALWDYSEYFDQIIQRYEGTIAGQFFGHTHHDQWEIAYTDYLNQTAANAVGVSYITNALTPTSGNPTFRVYSVDPETWSVLDYTTYFTNMSLATFQEEPKWEKYYGFKETYGPLVSPPYTDPSAELTGAFMHNVTEVFVKDDAQFQAYNARKTRGFGVTPCTGDCKYMEICQLRSPQSQFNCIGNAVNAQEPANFTKREAEFYSHAVDDCHQAAWEGTAKAIRADMSGFKRKLVRRYGDEL